MKTFFKNIGNTIVKKLRKHPLICNFVLSVVLAFVLEVLGRQTFDLSAVGFVDQRSFIGLPPEGYVYYETLKNRYPNVRILTWKIGRASCRERVSSPV